MAEKIRILIADDITDTRALIIRLLSMSDRFEVVGEAVNGKAVIDFFEHNDADMVLMDINMPVLNGLEATRQLTAIRADVIVVIMSVQSESEYLKKAMLSGAKEYIIKPFNFEMLNQTLESTYNEYKLRAIAQREALIHGQTHVQTNAIIHCVFSGKGSVGKTFFATRAAWEICKHEHKRVLIIDGDLQYGDIGLSLGLKASPNLGELSEDRHTLTYELVQSYLHKPFENCEVLLAPSRPEAAEGIGKDFIEELLKIVISHYDVIVVDLGVNYSEETLTFLDAADKIHLMTIPTVSALHHTKITLEVMRSLNYEKSKTPLVLNVFNKQCGFTLKEIETVLNMEVKCVINDEPNIITEALNRGDMNLQSKGFGKPKVLKQIGDYAKTMI